jgi:hypothetical protein
MSGVHRSSQGAVECAATVLQPEQDILGQSRENDVVRNARNRLKERFSQQGSTYPESVDLTYKEEVAGSDPASPT